MSPFLSVLQAGFCLLIGIEGLAQGEVAGGVGRGLSGQVQVLFVCVFFLTFFSDCKTNTFSCKTVKQNTYSKSKILPQTRPSR